MLETFNTENAAPGDRLQEWNAVAKATFGEIEVFPIDRESFNGRMMKRGGGSVTLASVESAPAAVRGASDFAYSSVGHFILLNESGESYVEQAGRDAHLAPGDLTVLRADAPYVITFDQPNHTLVAHIPAHRKRIDWNISARRPHTASEIPVLVSLLRQWMRSSGGEPHINPRAYGQLVEDVLAVTWPGSPAIEPRASEAMDHWEEHIEAYLRSHVAEPLTSRVIGDALGISARYVQKIMARKGTTISRRVLERRLEATADRLLEDGAAHITDVAFEAGFNDLSYFCRSFKARFGYSAREWRAVNAGR